MRWGMPEMGFVQPPPLQYGVDSYVENGRWVFTERRHLKRGYCCGSGCRHCPYPLREGRADSGQPAIHDVDSKAPM